MQKLDQNYLGSYPRDALKILKFIAERYPKKLLFTSPELGKVIGQEGKELGGILGTFSKREGDPLIVKVGTTIIYWERERTGRPKQVWALNPELRKSEISQIRKILSTFLLEEKVRV